jgi:transcriptional regulator with XRE-family HTH domain
MTGFKRYKSYSFTHQDPIIKEVKAIMYKEGLNASQISKASGVSDTTIRNWVHGKTRRPQHAAVMAALGGAGYTMVVKKK